MKIDDLQADLLEQWQADEVTRTLKAAIFQRLDAEERFAKDAYWSGNPHPPEYVIASKMARDLMEDFFEASVDDLRAMMETQDESERD